jgi:hypothetical protein
LETSAITSHAAATKDAQDRQVLSNNATRVVASTFGVLVGLAGIEHGLFEALQGNAATGGIMIHAIGPEQRFWPYGTETAMTMLPTFLGAGIAAVAFGILLAIWAGRFVTAKHGAGILMLLSVTLWLVGGGFAPIFMTVIASIAAIEIHKSLNWWRTQSSPTSRNLLAKMWPWSILAFVIVFVIAVEIAIFGYPLLWIYGADVTFSIQSAFAYLMLALMPLTILTAVARDSSGKGSNRFEGR